MSTGTTQYMNKRAILNRMLRFAANHLGVKRVESLDPLVSLFIESLAEEVYKLSAEMDNIESRMQETLSGMLCPDISLSARPAHCILHATPDESRSILTKETPFTFKDKKHKEEGWGQLSFYPVCKTMIRKGDVRYTVHNGLFHQIEEDQGKTLISRSRNTEFVEKRSYWIALELDESIHTLENLSFYFDFPGVSKKNEYLHLLAFMSWKLNGKAISNKQGLYVIEDKQEDNIVELFNSLDISESLDRSILETYDKHFLTITDNRDILSQKKAFPQELIPYFPEHLPEDFTHPLIWLEIDYPSQLNAAAVEAMTVSINAFPVANKSLQAKTIEVNELLQIIPLGTGNHESLLAVHSLTDARGRKYFELPFDDTDRQYRTYSLRRGGYERYSKREAREYLANLTYILDSHSSVRTTNDESIEEALSGVHNLVEHIKKTVSGLKEKLEIQSYILIDNPDENDVFFVKYWTTLCEQANAIKQHTVLDCTSAQLSVIPSSVFTLSSTIGGKPAPQSTERQNLRIKSLLDRTVLVTNEDIIRFCKSEFGDMVSGIKISGGIMESPMKDEGFIRTTDITLTPRKGLELLWNENETGAFEQILRKNSPATCNYRIFINNKN